jgi:NitT/TauT family transport system ATP-binding protein
MADKIGLDRLNRSYYVRDRESGKKVKFQALKDFTLSIRDGEFITIVGPSGCGKSTLLDILAGLAKADSGRLTIDGQTVNGPALDRGFVMQSYALFPWRTIRKNVEFGLELKNIPRKERKAVSDEFLELVGLAGFADRYPHELSGGMKQRIAIARALAYDPKILLMDEPFAAVDAQTREKLQDELIDIWAQTGKTIVFVTHSIEEAVLLADRVVVMTDTPGTVKEVIPVGLPRPRANTQGARGEEYHSIVNRVWRLLHKEEPRALNHLPAQRARPVRVLGQQALGR